MNKKLKKAMAIVSLVFMALFSVAIVLFFIDRSMFNGSIGYVAIFTGFVGIAVFVVIKLTSRIEEKNAAFKDGDLGSDNGEETKTEEADKPDETETLDGAENNADGDEPAESSLKREEDDKEA